MKNFFKRLFKKYFDYLADRFHHTVKWLNDELYNWLPKVLKGLGFSGMAAIVLETFKTSFDDSVEKFGFFARLLQIDDIFDSINDVFTPFLSGHLNTDFIGVCNAFGIIAAINEILGAIGWSLIIYAFLFVCRLIFNAAAALLLRFGFL